MLPKVGKKEGYNLCPRLEAHYLTLLHLKGSRTGHYSTDCLGGPYLVTNGILSPQHGGALPKRSTMDLIASFTHDIKAAIAIGREITIVTIDVQGPFNALLIRRLLICITKQDWPLSLL